MRRFFGALIRIIVMIVMAPPRGVMWIARKIWQGIKWLGRKIWDIIQWTMRSPKAAYLKAKSGRDWLLERIEFLQSESAKWRTTFTILRSPYSLMLKLGFSPTQAVSLLAAGSVATSGVVVNETIIDRPPSFAAGDPGVYNAPSDRPIFTDKEFNTLRLDLGTTPIGVVQIEDITVGSAYAGSALPSGETKPVIVGGLPTVADPAFTETYLEVGHMTVD